VWRLSLSLHLLGWQALHLLFFLHPCLNLLDLQEDLRLLSLLYPCLSLCLSLLQQQPYQPQFL
jgi:hypothetical protein